MNPKALKSVIKRKLMEPLLSVLMLQMFPFSECKEVGQKNKVQMNE